MRVTLPEDSDAEGTAANLSYTAVSHGAQYHFAEDEDSADSSADEELVDEDSGDEIAAVRTRDVFLERFGIVVVIASAVAICINSVWRPLAEKHDKPPPTAAHIMRSHFAQNHPANTTLATSHKQSELMPPQPYATVATTTAKLQSSASTPQSLGSHHHQFAAATQQVMIATSTTLANDMATAAAASAVGEPLVASTTAAGKAPPQEPPGATTTTVSIYSPLFGAPPRATTTTTTSTTTTTASTSSGTTTSTTLEPWGKSFTSSQPVICAFNHTGYWRDFLNTVCMPAFQRTIAAVQMVDPSYVYSMKTSGSQHYPEFVSQKEGVVGALKVTFSLHLPLTMSMSHELEDQDLLWQKPGSATAGCCIQGCRDFRDFKDCKQK